MLESRWLINLGGLIGGQWVQQVAESRWEVTNRATGEVLARLPVMGRAECEAAVTAAAAVLDRPPSPEARRAWLLSVHDLLLDQRQELARIITLEHGKPLQEATAEVEYTAGFFRYFAEQLDQLRPATLPGRRRNCRWTRYARPAGVAGLITPWNFPLAMLGKKLAPALASGCATVLKPASQTPLSAIACCHIAEAAGVPPGWINLLVGRAEPIGEVLCRHSAVRVISFTGSTETGKLLAAQAAPYVKRLALELGGNAPCIVFDDCDVEAAAAALVSNKFRAGGQTCVCTNRVLVQETIAERFTEAVTRRVARLKVGNGLDPDTDVGPLIDRASFDKVAAHVADALHRGARRLVGFDPPRPAHDWGAFYPPTVLTGLTPAMRVCREETFGPLVAIGAFATEDAVVQWANSTPQGLAAYLFTADADRASRLIPRLHFGHVGLNTGTGPTPEAPFGGMKESGFGREGGSEGLWEYCEIQVVAEA